jgi:hypothetical protein
MKGIINLRIAAASTRRALSGYNGGLPANRAGAVQKELQTTYVAS